MMMMMMVMMATMMITMMKMMMMMMMMMKMVMMTTTVEVVVVVVVTITMMMMMMMTTMKKMMMMMAMMVVVTITMMMMMKMMMTMTMMVMKMNNDGEEEEDDDDDDDDDDDAFPGVCAGPAEQRRRHCGARPVQHLPVGVRGRRERADAAVPPLLPRELHRQLAAAEQELPRLQARRRRLPIAAAVHKPPPQAANYTVNCAIIMLSGPSRRAAEASSVYIMHLLLYCLPSAHVLYNERKITAIISSASAGSPLMTARASSCGRVMHHMVYML